MREIATITGNVEKKDAKTLELKGKKVKVKIEAI
jgi:hypothetical protein